MEKYTHVHKHTENIHHTIYITQLFLDKMFVLLIFSKTMKQKKTTQNGHNNNYNKTIYYYEVAHGYVLPMKYSIFKLLTYCTFTQTTFKSIR